MHISGRGKRRTEVQPPRRHKCKASHVCVGLADSREINAKAVRFYSSLVGQARPVRLKPRRLRTLNAIATPLRCEMKTKSFVLW